VGVFEGVDADLVDDPVVGLGAVSRIRWRSCGLRPAAVSPAFEQLLHGGGGVGRACGGLGLGVGSTASTGPRTMLRTGAAATWSSSVRSAGVSFSASAASREARVAVSFSVSVSGRPVEQLLERDTLSR